jgi:carbon storage regulator CsrA
MPKLIKPKGNYGLALTLKTGGQILIGEDIIVTLNKYSPSQIRVVVKAPKSIKIKRSHISEEKNTDVRPKLEVLPKIKY